MNGKTTDPTYNGGGLKRFAVDLLYPNRCPFCDGFIPYDRACCTECFDSVLWADELICPVCGKSTRSGCICPVPYRRCFTAFYYEGKGKYGIKSLKYRSHPDCAQLYGRVLRDRMDIAGATEGIDAAVPVPMAPKSLRERGYDQAELIARGIIKGSDIELLTHALRRLDPEREQHTLSAAERRQEAERQYSAGSDIDKVRDKVILLVDDVLTTGATLTACTNVLMKNGALQVICAAAATV